MGSATVQGIAAVEKAGQPMVGRPAFLFPAGAAEIWHGGFSSGFRREWATTQLVGAGGLARNRRSIRRPSPVSPASRPAASPEEGCHLAIKAILIRGRHHLPCHQLPQEWQHQSEETEQQPSRQKAHDQAEGYRDPDRQVGSDAKCQGPRNGERDSYQQMRKREFPHTLEKYELSGEEVRES